MKTLLIGLLALGVLIGGYGGGASAAPGKTRVAKATSVVYVCANCGTGAARSGLCPTCKMAMGRVATYACMKCQISADHTGPCPNCREPMSSVVARYRRCSACGFSHTRTKKSCPVCVKRLKKKR